MVFSSTIFLFGFLPITLGGYYLIQERFRNTWLLMMSLIFFAWSQLGYVWIILVSVLINYLAAMFIENAITQRYKRVVLFCVVAANLTLLFWFKYLDFTLATLNSIFHTSYAQKGIVLPIGISFFTFQGMSYAIDVYRGSEHAKVQKNPLNVALYIMLFPQLIAGPIVRYSDVAREIEHRNSSLNEVSEGIVRFSVGLFRKVVIANSMASIVDTIWTNGIENNTVLIAWLGSIAYSLQIYFDFSGYSDMAIGLGKIFGFHFLENFNLPYTAKSVRDFWRRWHISLSTWFRDYVYIPLGGNRRHVYMNLCIVFLLTGIWHGASWTFVVWGMWHGLFLIIERVLGSRNSSKLHTQAHKWELALGHAYTLFVVNIGWVLFRADSFLGAIHYIETMFGIGLGNRPVVSVVWYLNRWNSSVLLIAILLSSGFMEKLREKMQQRCSTSCYLAMRNAGALALLLFSILRVVSGTYNPFIYFQF